MSAPAGTADKDARTITAQCGRAPRRPFRVATRCEYGFPTVIVSPALLEDGELFPTFAWLTCPWLVREASRAESDGEMACWTELADNDESFVSQLAIADAQLRGLRAAESGGVDACGDAGVAGRRDSRAIKCLHARIAASLVGMDDPVGRQVLDRLGPVCADRRCERLGSG